MFNRILINYLITAEKMFYVGFGVKIPYYNNNILHSFNKCVSNGFIYAAYPITGPYFLYKLYKN